MGAAEHDHAQRSAPRHPPHNCCFPPVILRFVERGLIARQGIGGCRVLFNVTENGRNTIGKCFGIPEPWLALDRRASSSSLLNNDCAADWKQCSLAIRTRTARERIRLTRIKCIHFTFIRIDGTAR